MTNKYFAKVEKPIPYEGKDSKNPLAFKYYNKNQKVGNKTMAEHLRFSVAFWHTMMGNGGDMFGGQVLKENGENLQTRCNVPKILWTRISNFCKNAE